MTQEEKTKLLEELNKNPFLHHAQVRKKLSDAIKVGRITEEEGVEIYRTFKILREESFGPGY